MENKKTETLKIMGYSTGDSSVGIYPGNFNLDLGIEPENVNDEDKKWIIKTIIKSIWELHDNGNLKFNFSDELKKSNWDYTRGFTNEDNDYINKEELAKSLK